MRCTWTTLAALIVATFLLLLSFYTVHQPHYRNTNDRPPQQPKKTKSTSHFMDLDFDPVDDKTTTIEQHSDPTTDDTTKHQQHHKQHWHHPTHYPPSLSPLFVTKSSLYNLHQSLESIVPPPTTSSTILPTYTYKELPFQTPDEETTFYDADQPRSTSSEGPRLKFTGESLSMSYLSTALFVVSETLPEIGNKLHFIGQASFSDDLTVELHVSTPPGDNFWYVTLKDVIKKNSNGENQTPVIAYTECKANPWQLDDTNRCQWMVHEGPDIGWKKSRTLKLTLMK